MIEQVQTSSSNGISLLAGKGKGTAAGVFANLFKALGHTAINGKMLLKSAHAATEKDKATALAEAAAMGQSDLVQALKAQKAKAGHAQHAKNTGNKDKTGKTAHHKTHDKSHVENQAPATAVEVAPRQPATGDADKAQSAMAVNVKQGKPEQSAKEGASRAAATLPQAKGPQPAHEQARQHTSHRTVHQDTEPTVDHETAQAGMQRAAAPEAVHAGTPQPLSATNSHDAEAAKPAKAAPTTQTVPGPVAAKAHATARPETLPTHHQPVTEIADDATRAPAAPNLPTKLAQTTRHKAAQPVHAAEQTAQATSTNPQQAAQQQVMSDTLQHDAEAMQQIRDAISAVTVKNNREQVHKEAAADEARSTGLAAAAAHLRHTATAQPSQATGMQAGQIPTAASANETANQGNGHSSGRNQHEAADARAFSPTHVTNRPQHHFTVPQQLASRMPVPVRPLEAMQSIAQSAANGSTRIELQLEPAHLGKVHVSLQTDPSKQLQMHLTVEHAMARHVIEQHLPQLRAALEQQGLSLDNFSLHTGSGQQQHQQQQQAFEYAAMAQQQAANPAPVANMPVPAGIETRSAVLSSGLSIRI